MKQKRTGLLVGFFVVLCSFLFGGINVFGESIGTSNSALPEKNYMSCSDSVKSGIMDGKIACYGLSTKDNSFGGSSNTCLKTYNSAGASSLSSENVGCQVKTSICKSGYAVATKYIVPAKLSLTGSDLSIYAETLRSSPEFVSRYISGLWIYSCGTSVERGTFSLYADGKSVVSGSDMTRDTAYSQCKEKASSYKTSDVVCYWNNEKILSIPKTAQTGLFVFYANGNAINNGEMLTKEDAYSKCKDKASSYKTSDVVCYWNNEKILSIPMTPQTGLFVFYANGNAINNGEMLTKEDAYSKCKDKASSYKTSDVVCYWNDEKILSIPKTTQTGTLVIKVNRESIFSGNDLTKDTAYSKCKDKASSYKNAEYICYWNNEKIFSLSSTSETGSLVVKVNGETVSTGMDMTESTALTKCKEKAKSYIGDEIKCTWNKKEIYYLPKTTESDYFIMKVDGKTIISGMDMTEDTALSKCKEKAKYYQGSEIVCTWGKTEIYYLAAVKKTGTLEVIVNDNSVMTGVDMTKDTALTQCKNKAKSYIDVTVVCTWNDEEIYRVSGNVPKTCGTGYTYSSTTNTCVKNDKPEYYDELKKEFSSLLTSLSVEKLKIVLERIEKLQKSSSISDTVYKRLETLKVLIKEEITKKESEIDLKKLFEF